MQGDNVVKMLSTTITLHTKFRIGEVDPRIFGGFLERMGRAARALTRLRKLSGAQINLSGALSGGKEAVLLPRLGENIH